MIFWNNLALRKFVHRFMFNLTYKHISLPPHTYTHQKKSTNKVEISNKCSLLSPKCHQRTAVSPLRLGGTRPLRLL